MSHGLSRRDLLGDLAAAVLAPKALAGALGPAEEKVRQGAAQKPSGPGNTQNFQEPTQGLWTQPWTYEEAELWANRTGCTDVDGAEWYLFGTDSICKVGRTRNGVWEEWHGDRWTPVVPSP